MIYELPTMADIRALPWNGLNVVSTFSGCGGSSLGYRMAGSRVLYANEFIPAAAETYRANAAPYTVVDTRDIRTVTGHDILQRINMEPGELDILDGSPPCSAFSRAGKGAKGYGKAKTYSSVKTQVVDDLFFEYARILRDIQPRAFIAENVKGLVMGAAKGYFLRIMSELKAAGYTVKAQVLNASWLGVPQARERLIFIGIRNDLNKSPQFPKPLPKQLSLRDAYDYLERHNLISENPYVDPETGTNLDIRPYSIYKYWKELQPGENHTKRFSLRKASPNKPFYTLMASDANVGTAGICHWSQPRKFSHAEMRAFSGVPRDFILTGTHEQRGERLGRLVPPPMMKEIASAVTRTLGETQ